MPKILETPSNPTSDTVERIDAHRRPLFERSSNKMHAAESTRSRSKSESGPLTTDYALFLSMEEKEEWLAQYSEHKKKEKEEKKEQKKKRRRSLTSKLSRRFSSILKGGSKLSSLPEGEPSVRSEEGYYHTKEEEEEVASSGNVLSTARPATSASTPSSASSSGPPSPEMSPALSSIYERLSNSCVAAPTNPRGSRRQRRLTSPESMFTKDFPFTINALEEEEEGDETKEEDLRRQQMLAASMPVVPTAKVNDLSKPPSRPPPSPNEYFEATNPPPSPLSLAPKQQNNKKQSLPTLPSASSSTLLSDTLFLHIPLPRVPSSSSQRREPLSARGKKERPLPRPPVPGVLAVAPDEYANFLDQFCWSDEATKYYHLH
ncbi:hypothetical protein QOT17_019223 [Balamuthia mandrillaris]